MISSNEDPKSDTETIEGEFAASYKQNLIISAGDKNEGIRKEAENGKKKSIWDKPKSLLSSFSGSISGFFSGLFKNSDSNQPGRNDDDDSGPRSQQVNN